VAANYTFLASFLSASAVLLAAISLGIAITTGYFRPQNLAVWIAGNLVLGSAALSVVIFFTGRFVAISKPLFVAIFLVCLVSGLLRFRKNLPEWRIAPSLPSLWILAAIGMLYFALYVFTASFPETSPDGSSYHLGYLARYIAAGHIYNVETSFYPMLSQGFEMLYLPALLFGGGPATALFHTLFVSVMLLLFAGLGELLPISTPELAAAAVVFYVSPVVGRTATTAYVDPAAACICLGAVYFTLLACRELKTAHLIFAGICCSFALSVKLSTLPIVPLCLFLLLIKARPRWKNSWKNITIFLVACCAIEAVWLGRNWIWYGNPIIPFGDSLFPNPYVHASFEMEYRQDLAHFNGLSLSPSLFLETTVRGFISQGLVGPLYLLFPLAAIILILKKKFLWPIATLVMLLAYPQNLGTRFLEPALPFAALTIVGAIAALVPRMVTPVAIVAAVACWPSVVDSYAQAHPFARALPAPTEETIFHRPAVTPWLAAHLNAYPTVSYLNVHLPADANVFAQSGLPLFYVRQNIRVWYESAENERLRDVLWMGLQPAIYPLVHVTLHLPSPSAVTHLRLIPDHVSPQAKWSISEISPTPSRSTCAPNSYDCQFLTDGNPLTVWRNWEPLTNAAHIDLNFKEPVTLSTLELLCPRNTTSIGFRIETCQGEDCRSIPTTTSIQDVNPERAEFLAQEFHRVGIRYLLLEDANLIASAQLSLRELFADKQLHLFEVASK